MKYLILASGGLQLTRSRFFTENTPGEAVHTLKYKLNMSHQKKEIPVLALKDCVTKMDCITMQLVTSSIPHPEKPEKAFSGMRIQFCCYLNMVNPHGTSFFRFEQQ